MAVKRYDGSQWVTVAGKGDQGTSSSIATWVKTATGGETSVSGNDDNSQPLSYTVGQELVFINGALQKRGADYTATTGNSITGLTALAANDVVTVWTVNAFSVTNAISNTLVDAKGDLVTASGADVPARLGVGSNGQVLTADSTTGTGLKWATPAGGKVLQVVSTTKSDTFSSNSTSLIDITGMSVSITPSSTSSKIYVMYTLSAQAVTGSSVFVSLLLRDTTPIARGDAAGSRTRVTTPNIRETDNAAMGSAVGLFLDSPATTSAITYKIQGRGTGGTWYINTYASDSDSADAFRSISTITAWEIGA